MPINKLFHLKGVAYQYKIAESLYALLLILWTLDQIILIQTSCCQAPHLLTLATEITDA